MPKYRLNDDTVVLINRLREAKQGEVISYLECTKLIGRDVQRDVPHLLRSARKALECQEILEERRCFDAIRNIGIKCLRDGEISRAGRTQIRRAHNLASGGVRKMLCVQNYDAMSNEEKVSHNTALSLLGAMVAFTRPKAVKQLETKVTHYGKTLPLEATLQVFRA